MTQYLITKREKCDYYAHYSGGHANCKHCDKQGNIDTPVDLLDLLNTKLQVKQYTDSSGREYEWKPLFRTQLRIIED